MYMYIYFDALTNKVVGDCAHRMVPPDGEADEKVADQTNQEHQEVGDDEKTLEQRRRDVVDDHVQVVVLTDTVHVRTHRRHR